MLRIVANFHFFVNFQILMSVLWNLILATITPVVSTLLVHTAANASRDSLGMVQIVQVCLCEDTIKTLSTYQSHDIKTTILCPD